MTNAACHMQSVLSVSPVRHMQAVFPALYQSADDLQVVAENGPFRVEAVLHQKLQEPIGEDFISGVSLEWTSLVR